MKPKVRNYLLLLFLVFTYIFICHYISLIALVYQKVHFRALPLLLTEILIYIFFGSILGLDTFCKEYKKKKGKWKIKKEKLIVLGILSFYFSLIPIYHYLHINFFIIKKISSYLLSIKYLPNFFQLLFGFTIATSIYKDEKNKN